MPIPDFQSCFMPILKTLSDRGLMTSRDLVAAISDHFTLSEAERRELLPSGNQEVINNRVGWAKTYLKKAGLVESPRKGQVAITNEGRKVLAANPAKLNIRFLKDGYEQFRAFHTSKARDAKPAPEESPEDQVDNALTPEEQVEQSHQTLRQELVAEILDRLHGCSPQRFERLVVEVMVGMGYGGTLIPAVVLNKLHFLRMQGNQAVHGKPVSAAGANATLREGFDLACWFHIAFGGGKQGDCPAFTPPSAVDSKGELKRQRKAALERAQAAEAQLMLASPSQYDGTGRCPQLASCW